MITLMMTGHQRSAMSISIVFGTFVIFWSLLAIRSYAVPGVAAVTDSTISVLAYFTLFWMRYRDWRVDARWSRQCTFCHTETTQLHMVGLANLVMSAVNLPNLNTFRLGTVFGRHRYTTKAEDDSHGNGAW